MMLWDNIRIFLTLQYIYIYFAVWFLIIPFIKPTNYYNIISCIGFFSCIMLLYLDKIFKEVQNGSTK